MIINEIELDSDASSEMEFYSLDNEWVSEGEDDSYVSANEFLSSWDMKEGNGLIEVEQLVEFLPDLPAEQHLKAGQSQISCLTTDELASSNIFDQTDPSPTLYKNKFQQNLQFFSQLAKETPTRLPITPVVPITTPILKKIPPVHIVRDHKATNTPVINYINSTTQTDEVVQENVKSQLHQYLHPPPMYSNISNTGDTQPDIDLLCLTDYCHKVEPKSDNAITQSQVQLTHIDDSICSSSTSSTTSTSDSSLASSCKLYLATPATANLFIMDGDHQFNGSNSQPHLTPPFLKTSTPLHSLTRPSSSRLQTASFDGKRKYLHHLNPDKRIFLSLYNLTCDNTFSSHANSKHLNPTNIFFTNSKSYGSLKETDLDTGQAQDHLLYKETDLDYHGDRVKLSAKSRGTNRLHLCEGLDEDILNKSCPTASSQGDMQNCNLIRRLYSAANSPAQLRVARSTSRLNVPVWLADLDSTCNSPNVSSRYNESTASYKSSTLNYNTTSSLYNKNFSQLPKSSTLPTSPPSKLEMYQNTIKSKSYNQIKSKPVVLPRHQLHHKLSPKLAPILQCKARSTAHSGLSSISQKCLDIIQKPSGSLLQSFCDYKNSRLSFNEAVKKDPQLKCSSCSSTSSNPLSNYLCDYCATYFCSNKCLNLHHSSSKCSCCFLIQWMESIHSRLQSSCLHQMLSEMYSIGLSLMGNGFIRMKIPEIPSRIRDCPCYIPSSSYSHNTDTSFPLELSVQPRISISNSIISIIHNLPRLNYKHVATPFPVSKTHNRTDHCDLPTPKSSNILPAIYTPITDISNDKSSNQYTSNDSTNNIQLSHNSSSISTKSVPTRQRLFTHTLQLLYQHNINLQTSYPTLYTQWSDYVTQGRMFPEQQIFIPQSSLLISIKPDFSPELMELL